MPLLTYNGPQPERDVQIGDGQFAHVKRGESFEVPENIAERLCEQRYFSRAKSAKRSDAVRVKPEPTELARPEPRVEKED